MPPASAAAFCAIPAPCPTLRGMMAVGAPMAQAVGFAALLWLLAAGPGALADRASTVPLHADSSR